MSTFDEFKNRATVPSQDSGSIISHAFEMYKGTVLYGVLTLVIVFGISWIAQLLSGFDSKIILEEMKSGNGDINYFAIPGIKTYYGLSTLFSILTTPLYVGFLYIINKYNNHEAIDMGDLFIGYKQNTVNILIYSILNMIIIGISCAMCVVPVLFVAPLLMLGYPILLFENTTAIDALKKSFETAKNNYGTFLGVFLLSVLISLAGIILCGVGIIISYPFIFVAMYSLYCAYLGKPRRLITK